MESLKHTAMLVLIIPLFLIHGALSGHIRAEAGPPTLKVRPLSPDRHITVGDRALSDWDRSLVVMEIDAQSAPLKQWKTLNRGAPLPLKQGDIELTVFMSWSDSDWYIAVDARDDAVLGVPASSQYPYSGDCVEIFFAGKNLNSKADLHDYVESPRTPDQAAFFQLDLPASQLGDPAFYLPDWRTDTSLKARALKSGFAVSTWRVTSGWSVEARFPLSALEPAVVKNLKSHAPLKVNLVYLDYDLKIAARTQEEFWGFNPDNVFALAGDESAAHTPLLMRTIVFE